MMLLHIAIITSSNIIKRKYYWIVLRSLTFCAFAALRILFLYILEQVFQAEVRVLDGLGIGHDTIFHGFVDNLNRVQGSHGCCSQNLVIFLANVVGHELHLFEVSYNMKVVPSPGDSSENKRIVELPCPEEGNVVDWMLLAIHIESCY